MKQLIVKEQRIITTTNNLEKQHNEERERIEKQAEKNIEKLRETNEKNVEAIKEKVD